MKRRHFLKILGGSGLMAALPVSLPGVISAARAADVTPWRGLVLLSVNLAGGQDQSSWTDPRNDPEVNHYARNGQAGKAGNLWYAPLGENREFFEKYYDRMMVINGIDLQTNSHSGARQHVQTGKLADGFPSLMALYAATAGQGLPLPWLRLAGPGFTGDLQPYTTLNDGVNLASLADPNAYNQETRYFRAADWELLNRYRLARLRRLMAGGNGNLPREQRQIEQMYKARLNQKLFFRLKEKLPSSFDYERPSNRVERVMNQVHKALVCFDAGVTVAAGVETPGNWDTHDSQDAKIDDLCINLTSVIDYIWTKAEQMGVADRLLVHIGSDVGRTPRYNSRNGKDHWKVSSAVLMMKNQPWTNRIVGVSGPKHELTALNPQTLQPDTSGITLRPAHVNRAMRRILAIDQHPLAQKYEFAEAELDLLNPGVQSPFDA